MIRKYRRRGGWIRSFVMMESTTCRRMRMDVQAWPDGARNTPQGAEPALGMPSPVKGQFLLEL